MWRPGRTPIVAGAGLALLGLWAYGRQSADEQEKRIRQAAFTYYSSTILGDAEGCLRVAKFPLVAIRDGKVITHTAETLRSLVLGVSKRIGIARMSADEKQELLGKTLQVFDDADIQFLGANTATVVFLVRPPATKGEGNTLGQLVVVRSGGAWKVTAEVSDSKPGPPEPELPELRAPPNPAGTGSGATPPRHGE